MEAGRGEEGRRHHSLQLFLKYTGGENVSHGVQSEGLAMMEGTRVDVKDNSVAYDIDTSKISFVFCGAFSARAADIAEKEGGTRIGFGAPGGAAPPARTGDKALSTNTWHIWRCTCHFTSWADTSQTEVWQIPRWYKPQTSGTGRFYGCQQNR